MAGPSPPPAAQGAEGALVPDPDRTSHGTDRVRLAERVAAAAYGTVLVLAAIALIDADDVATGAGGELVIGVGVATWLAHLYAEVIGDHVRCGAPSDRKEVRRAAVDGSPILLASVPPAVILLLGRIGAVSAGVALWGSFAFAALQLVGLGAVVRSSMSGVRVMTWSYVAWTAIVGVLVATLKLLLGH